MEQASEFATSRSAALDSPKSVARAILDTLENRGVTAAFGIPGGLIGPLFNCLNDVTSIKLTNTRHEGIAAFAAIGHALATGTPAIVLTTAGPGITNTITGIAAAKEEQAPLLFIGGDVPAGATSRAAIQDSSSNGIDSVALMRTVAKASFRIDHPAGAIGAIEHALRIAMTPPCGPVFISLPVDISNLPTPPVPLSLPAPPSPLEPDLEACKEIARALFTARAPLIVAGNGARGAADFVRALAERTYCPVVTTPHSKGVFPDSHPLHIGQIGLGGHPSALAYLREKPDVVLVVGSRLGDFATNGWALSVEGSKATYQIDHELRLLGRNVKLTKGVLADASITLEKILDYLPQDVGVRPGIKERCYLFPESMDSDASPLTPARALLGLQAAFPQATWIADQGENCAYALHYLSIDRPDRFFSLVGLASMGSGFGAAIGYAQARKSKRPVIAIVGDGGFAMHAGELLTCVEQEIPLIVAVINDGMWNMVEHGFAATYGRRVESFPTHIADIAGVAREFGAIGIRISEPADLERSKLAGLAHLKQTVVLDIRINPMLPLSIHSRIASITDFVSKT